MTGRTTPAGAARRALRLAATACALGACEHPIAIVTPHVEAADVVLRARGAPPDVVLARTHDNRRWSGGPLIVADRDGRELAVTLLDFEGRPVAGLDARDDVELRVEAETPRPERPGAVVWEPRRGHGVLHGLAPGPTRVRVLVWHGTHADLVTPWLDVVVEPTIAAARTPTPEPVP
jgi:hypothetical protein